MREWKYVLINQYNKKYITHVKTLEEMWFQIIDFLKNIDVLNSLNKGMFFETHSKLGKYCKNYKIINEIPPFTIKITKKTKGDINKKEFIKIRNLIYEKYKLLKGL